MHRIGPGGKSNWFEAHVSRYAGTNYEEALAESFCAYTDPDYKKGMLPKDVESFMEKHFPRKGE